LGYTINLSLRLYVNKLSGYVIVCTRMPYGIKYDRFDGINQTENIWLPSVWANLFFKVFKCLSKSHQSFYLCSAVASHIMHNW